MTRFCSCLLLLVAATASAEEPRTWTGSRIESINTLDGGTLLDVVNQIRAEIQKDEDSSVSVRIEVSDDDLRKISAKMALKKIPAIVALSHVASVGVFEFAFEDGVWVLRNTPIHERQYPDDIVTVTCQRADSAELRTLGLIEALDGTMSVQEGSKWPKEEWGLMKRIDDVIVLRAYRHEIESLNALLLLHRRGYPIPKINSDQNGAGPAATRPQSKSEGNEKPQPEAKGSSR